MINMNTCDTPEHLTPHIVGPVMDFFFTPSSPFLSTVLVFQKAIRLRPEATVKLVACKKKKKA